MMLNRNAVVKSKSNHPFKASIAPMSCHLRQPDGAREPIRIYVNMRFQSFTGRLMLVPQAIRDGYVAATNAVNGTNVSSLSPVNPIGSFTDPEYAQVGLTEAKARAIHDIVVSKGAV